MASLKATALAAITCISGPPCRPGKMALLMAFSCCAFIKIMPPRGPRRLLWVVDHVHHEDRAHVFCHFGKALEVDAQAVGRGTGDDELGFGLMGLALHGV